MINTLVDNSLSLMIDDAKVQKKILPTKRFLNLTLFVK